MEEGILSLRWNNHPSAFIHSLGTLLQKETYSDVTLACDGHFFPVHKLVLSVCSEYFEAIFNQTTCTKPVIVLKDIRHCDMLALLHYMYVGEANVPQSDLSRLIKAAECLRIKGLAVPDESPTPREKKRGVPSAEPSGSTSEQSAPKKRKPDLLNSVHNEGLEQLSDGDDIAEARRAVVQHTAPPSRQMNEEVSQHLALPVAASAASQVTILHPQQTITHQIHFQQQSHNAQQRQMNDDDPRATQDGVLVSHTIPEVWVEECSVKEEAKEPIKEEGSGKSNSINSLDGGMTDGEEEEDDDASEHASSSGAGLMHDLLAIPGAVGQQQEALVSWDGSSGSLTGYTLEGLIPEELRQQQPGAAGGVPPAAEGGGGAGGAAGSPVTVMGCPYCQRAFMYRSDLSRHVRTHTGERPYTCPHCPYRASQKSHLLEHVKRRHRVSVVPSSTTVAVPSTVSPSALVVPSGTLVVPASSLVVSGAGLTASLGTATASVHHTILHTPSHITSTTSAASSAVAVSPSTISLQQQQQLQVSSAATSHGVLYTTPHSSSSSQQLLYSPSNSPQQAVLHTPQHVTASPSLAGQQLISVSSSSAVQPHLASQVTSEEGSSNSSSSALQLHISPSSGGVQLISAHTTSSGGGGGQHHVNHVPSTSAGTSQHATSCCTSLHHHHSSSSLVLSPLHTPTYSGHHTTALPAHSTS